MAGIELGIPYYIYSSLAPSTVQAALNDTTSPVFSGYVTDITGLDDAGVRENAQVTTAGHGGWHGPFWKDRRPFTISGLVWPNFPLTARDLAQERLEGAMNLGLWTDNWLVWTPADGITRWVPFRVQQPSRVTKGASNVQRNFQIAGVSDDFRVGSLSTFTGASSGSGFVYTASATNLGNAPASPIFVVTGPATGGFTITNLNTSKSIRLNYGIGAGGETVTIDLSQRYPTVVSSTNGDVYGLIDPVNTDWTIAVEGYQVVAGGVNSFQMTLIGASGSGTTGFTVGSRYAWW